MRLNNIALPGYACGISGGHGDGNVVLMVGQRRRRWPTIKPTFWKYVVFAGLLVWVRLD